MIWNGIPVLSSSLMSCITRHLITTVLINYYLIKDKSKRQRLYIIKPNFQ